GPESRVRHPRARRGRRRPTSVLSDGGVDGGLDVDHEAAADGFARDYFGGGTCVQFSRPWYAGSRPALLRMLAGTWLCLVMSVLFWTWQLPECVGSWPWLPLPKRLSQKLPVTFSWSRPPPSPG